MTSYSFEVDGIPKAQPRPRAFSRKMGNGKYMARVYEAGTAEEWKARVIEAGRVMRPHQPLDVALSLSVNFSMPRPKSKSKKSDPDGMFPHTSKPDCDNLAKAVMDAMTQDGWFTDDAIVYHLNVLKRYHAKGGRPGAYVNVSTA